MTSLSVWLRDEQVGILSETPSGGMVFQYDPDRAVVSNSPPLSRTLPYNSEPIRGRTVDAFFAGLLPEGNVRQRVAANLGLSEGNDFALLSALGGDCAGAIRLLPLSSEMPEPGEPPPPLTLSQLASRLRDLPRRPLLAGEEGHRLSLAGAQSKLPIRWIEGEYTLSGFSHPSTHILKPESPDFPGLAAVEAFCLDLAGTVGIQVAKAETLSSIEEIPCLRVERYDRVIRHTEKKVLRLHQEDLCQSLGLPPHLKYQQEGGPSAADVIDCIRSWSTTPVLDLTHFLDLLVFNVLIGNADAHGKNFSWLYRDTTRRLAPAYDLVATTLWPDLSSRLAMRVGQAKFVEEVTLDHFLKFAETSGIGKTPFRTRIRELTEKMVQNLDETLNRHPSLTPAHADQLQEEIRRRIQKLN